MNFAFDNTYARELEGFYVPWQGDQAPAPRILRLNRPLAVSLGLDPDALDSAEGAAILSGSTAPDGAAPLAQAYAGHQFGGFSPQLGDGRALLLGEVIDRDGQRRDIHLKGSGPTPFSRGGDGKAVIGPVLREYIVAEAMAALGIPTTRALAATLTGEDILREGPRPGAVLARVAASHLRVGTFQFFAARRDTERLRQLTNYALARHGGGTDGGPTDEGQLALSLLSAVVAHQADLVARWMLVGFVHGVMNTDNMTISGETIDYGPCAFLDTYDPAACFSSIDQQGRYAYGNQPGIAQWNLTRLAEALLPLIDADEDKAVELATEKLTGFAPAYEAAWLSGMRAKLGLTTAQDGDQQLGTALLAVMAEGGADFTGLFRTLGPAAEGDTGPARAHFAQPAAFDAWLETWQNRLAAEPGEATEHRARIEAANPIYIPRNHLVEAALGAAEAGDMGPADTLLDALSAPYTERPGLAAYATAAPEDFGPYRTFCGT